MKTKILAALLVLSLAFNIAGLVFFICFLKVSGNYRSVKRERNQVITNLTAVRAANVVSDAIGSAQVVKRTFSSLMDGNQDYFAYMPPAAAGRLDNILIVYLHGMGSNYLEPFMCPSQTTIGQAVAGRYARACLLSPNYRGRAAWGSDAAMSDITQNIRELLQEFPFQRIVLMGTSMGGCTVLTYATQAPADIKEKICGIVSVEGAGDLGELCALTQNRSVKAAILSMIGIGSTAGGSDKRSPDAYARRSFLPNITRLDSQVRVAVVSASADSIVPPHLQQELVQALQAQHQPTKLITVAGGHGAPPADIYMQGLDFVLDRKPGVSG